MLVVQRQQVEAFPAFFAGLRGVAAVHQQGAALRRHRDQPDTAGKTCKPVQALVGGRQILVEKGIAARQQEGIDAASGQLDTQLGYALHHSPRGWR